MGPGEFMSGSIVLEVYLLQDSTLFKKLCKSIKMKESPVFQNHQESKEGKMTAATENIFKDALNLAPVERAELIERLFQSFDRTQDHRVDAAWATEIESRINGYDEGKIKASPAEDVFARINRR